jgi:hypothetical protein
VVYSGDVVCLNGNGYWSMLIRLQDRATDIPPRFIQVQFALPCAEHPQWLDRKPSVKKFRLKRQQDADSVLKEFYDCAPNSADECPHLPLWKRVPGMENEKLPFGQRVPSYRSIDLHLAPVVFRQLSRTPRLMFWRRAHAFGIEDHHSPSPRRSWAFLVGYCECRKVGPRCGQQQGDFCLSGALGSSLRL